MSLRQQGGIVQGEPKSTILYPIIEEQVYIQQRAIVLWKMWIFGLAFSGLIILFSAQLFAIGGPAAGDIIKIGGAFISVLAAFPFREMVSRRERLAVYMSLSVRFKSFESLSKPDQTALLSLANDALREALKR
jgi:hypothetical protein